MGKVIKPVRLLLFLIAVVLFLYSAYKFIFPMLSLMIIRKCLDSLIRIRLIEMGQTDILQQMKDHTMQMIRNWDFERGETSFAAMVGGRIVGMVTIMKSDYYPLLEICPWI